MATLGSMIVNVLANTSGFHKAINGVRGTLGSLQQMAGSVLGSVDALSAGIGAIGAGFSAHAIVGELRSVADEMDNLAKVSDRLGVSTEVFKGLEFGAGLAGVSSDSLASSLQFLSKQIGEAIHGGGKAKVVFDELGLSAERLSQMSADMQLRTIADELSGISDSAQRTRAALRLFGGDGAAMLNFLAEGEGAISSYMRQAERLGLTYSREEVAKVEAFNDAWETLTKTIGGITKDFVIDIAPAALEAVKALQETIEGVRAIRATNAAAKPDPADQWMQDFATRSIGTGQASWLTAWFNKSIGAATRLRIGRDVAKENSVNNAFTAAELQAGIDKFGGKFTDASIQANELRSGFGMFFGKGKATGVRGLEAAASGFREFSAAIDKAKAFGAKSLLMSSFGIGKTPVDTSWMERRDTEAQLRGLQFISDKLGLVKSLKDLRKMFFGSGYATAQQGGRFGVNSPLIKGSMEAARLELAQQNKPQKQILDESRKHTSLLTTIAKQLTLQVTGI